MATPFAKYQSEQVQQIAPGFVEAYGRAGASIGQGIASIGQSVAQGIEKADAKAKEEAKQQAFLASYIKRDPRIQGVNAFLANGDLKKDDQGNVYVPDEKKGMFDPTKTADAISFYNKTGGDASRLTGANLTRFVTEFEADKKFEADQAAKEAASLERQKTLAEINKMNADAADKYARAGIGATIGAFGSGQDMSTFQPPAIAMPSFVGGATPTTPVATGSSLLAGTQPQIGTSAPLGTSDVPRGFTPERYQAGVPLAATLRTAPTAPAVQTTPAPAPGARPAPLPAVATAPMPTNTTTTAASKAYLDEIPKLQQARVALDSAYQKDMAIDAANHQIALARITAMGATPDDIKALEETAKNRAARKQERYNTNVASLNERLAGFQKAADETRAAEKAAQGVKAEGRAEASEKRTTTEFEVKYGREGQPATPGTFKTFSQKIESKIQNAGVIPGRTGGSEANKMRRDAQEEHTKIMEQFPAWYDVGLTTEGANQYQFRMLDYPTAAPLSSTVRADAQTVVEGYAEGRVFLTNLLEAVQSTDESRIKNYLDRFLMTTSKDDVYAEGEQLGQFGVAAFRRAIVSGGNFSDADREYVQKLITQINSPNVFKDKDYMLAQTKKLASFIDAKFRSTLAAKGVRLDMKTSEAFLKREDVNGSNAPALENLERAKSYYQAYGIDPVKTTKPIKPNEVLDVASLDEKIKTARGAGNERYAKALEQIKKENIENKKKAAEKANEEARRARGA